MSERVRLGVLLATAASLVALALAAAGPAAPPTLPAAGPVTARKVLARERPDPNAKPVHVFRDLRADFVMQIVFAEHAQTGADGRDWVHVQLPMRPNGLRGWIPADSAELEPVRVEILVRRGARRLEVYRDGRRVFGTIVAVGKPGAETPLGNFYVTYRFEPDDPFYGPFALETSAYSRLSDWPGGGKVGIHGTSMPWLLGKAVSHGCVRVANSAALVLKRLVPVGSRITIVR